LKSIKVVRNISISSLRRDEGVFSVKLRIHYLSQNGFWTLLKP